MTVTAARRAPKPAYDRAVSIAVSALPYSLALRVHIAVVRFRSHAAPARVVIADCARIRKGPATSTATAQVAADRVSSRAAMTRPLRTHVLSVLLSMPS